MFTNIWKLSNILFKQPMGQEEFTSEIKKYFETGLPQRTQALGLLQCQVGTY